MKMDMFFRQIQFDQGSEFLLELLTIYSSIFRASEINLRVSSAGKFWHEHR